MRARTVKGSHFVALLSAMLIVGLVAGLTTSASAGASGTAVTAAKKKCSKKKKAASAKKKKCAKPVTPAPTPVPPVPPAPTTLAVTPTDFTFPTTEHGTQSDPQTFTVTNTGGAPSGVPTPSITETKNPIPGDPPGFVAGAGTCTAALPPGGTCAVSVRFTPTSNAGDAEYKAVLHVNASPGSDAQATLTGTAD